MKRGLTGRYEVSRIGGEEIRAFIPHPLPPNPPLQLDGERQNWIGGTRPGNAHFVPPPPQYVQQCMAELERFLHNSTLSYPALVKAALAHVQFETIHPFLDGNGRIGRLLISFILHYEGVLTKPLLYLSLYLKQHRQEYYHLLDKVCLEGDWEAWLDFFLEGVETTANNAVQTAQRLVALFSKDALRVQSHGGRSASSVLRIFEVFKQRPLLSLPEVCQRSGLSFPTAAKGVQVLEQLGIVRELTGRQRKRVFVYADYLNILNEGTVLQEEK